MSVDGVAAAAAASNGTDGGGDLTTHLSVTQPADGSKEDITLEPGSPNTTTVYVMSKIFLQTAAAQGIAGAFAFAAMLVTCHQVNSSPHLLTIKSTTSYNFRLFIDIDDDIMTLYSNNDECFATQKIPT